MLGHGLGVGDAGELPAGARQALELNHLVEEVAEAGERVLALLGLGRGGLLAHVHAATGAAGDEAFLAHDADRLVDRHGRDAEELGELAAGGQLLAGFELADQDRGSGARSLIASPAG